VFYFSHFIEDCNAYLAAWSPANVANKPSGQKTARCKRHNSQACFSYAQGRCKSWPEPTRLSVVSFCAEEAAGALVAVIVFAIWMPKTAEQETSSPES
jgi:hypothetical protein